MATNIEIKARVRDFTALQTQAEALSDVAVTILEQEDTFFNTPQGRLKLRILGEGAAQLIYYQRSDSAGPKRSDYYIFRTDDPESLKQVLSFAYGERGVVRKRRYLYLVGATRVHLDQVEDLGNFMELEVVLSPGQSAAHGQAIAEELMEKLGILPEDLLEGAYMDMLVSRDS